MAKKRVHELAKELEVESKIILDILTKAEMPGKTASSGLEEAVIEMIRAKLSGNKPKEKTDTPVQRPDISPETEVTLPELPPKEEVKPEEPVQRTEEKSEEPIQKEEESKSGISMSIKERMALRSQNLKDKFTSRPGLKDKLAMRAKVETVAEVAPQVEEKVPEKVPEKIPIKLQESERSLPSTDFNKKKLKEMVSAEQPVSKEIKEKVHSPETSRLKEQVYSESGTLPVATPSTAVIDKKAAEERKPESVSDKAKNKKSGKKDRENKGNFKKREIEEEERKLAKAAITKKKKRDWDKKEDEIEEPLSKEVEIYDGMNVKEIADKLHLKETEIIKELFMKGIMITVNQALDKEMITKIVLSHGFTLKQEKEKEDEIFEMKVEEMSQDESLLEIRHPVVTIMGHVDHGKTSLLDAIRKTKVTEGEAGGITQHIGAYQVNINNRLITFLDTPGHEAFTALRARGAKVTDIAVLVVAADDGVMPQTIEAINHAKAASVPIIVAINKMDKPDSNPDRVKQQLAEHDLVPEEWGGHTVTVPVSARAKTGLDDLLEMILLTADIQEIRSNPNKMAQGVIIESRLDRGMGAVATVLIQAGTLRVGDNFVVGTVYGKVRAMYNYLGKPIKEAKPSTPVQVTGYSSVPVAGELLKVVATDKEARAIAEKAQVTEREKSLTPVRTLNLESISEQIVAGKVKELNLVIKSDVQGSAEGLNQSLAKLSVEDVKLRIIHSAVGDVTETDVSLAAASSAIIIAFNVKVDQKIREIAENERVDIRNYNIIYRVTEDVQRALEGLLEPEMEEVLTGKVEVRNLFTIGKVNVIAGCYVTEGKVTRHSTIKIYRAGKLVHTGKIDSLKRFKDDVKEVAAGFECGISVEKFNDLKEGDIMEFYVMQVKAR